MSRYPIDTHDDERRASAAPVTTVPDTDPPVNGLLRPSPIAVTVSAYDTASAAMSLAGIPQAASVVTGCLSWLVTRQRADGSWGASVPEPHDTLVSTLAAALALRLASADGDGVVDFAPAEDVARAIARAIGFLAGFTPGLRDRIAALPGATESVAFELIVPHLATRAAAAGLPLEFADLAWIDELRARKISLISAASIPGSSVAHCVEVLDFDLDDATVRALIGGDGSVGCSPSAAAFVYGRTRDPAVFGLLDKASATTPGAGLPTIYPFDLFDECWTLHYLAAGGIPVDTLRPAVEALSALADGAALGMARYGVGVDADDTAVLLWLRNLCGLDCEFDALDRFAGPAGFLTYEYERNFSMSTNAHVLRTLRAHPNPSPAHLDAAVSALRRHRVGGAYWTDKWHLSPYYVTGEAVVALEGIAEDLHEAAVAWILETQHADASWGIDGGSCEETAYAVLALMNGTAGDPEVRGAVERAIGYLRAHHETQQLRELWIGKVLYCPFRVVRSAITAALMRFDSWISLVPEGSAAADTPTVPDSRSTEAARP
jgi:halimadienyl-diphosphate synthase